MSNILTFKRDIILPSNTQKIITSVNKDNFPHFKQQPLYDANGNEITDYRMINRSDKESVKPIAVLGKNYKLINHNEAYDTIHSVINRFCDNKNLSDIKENVQFSNNGGRMKVVYNLPKEFDFYADSEGLDETIVERLRSEGKDKISTRLVCTNSVDGTRSFVFAVEFLRLVCSNGMIGWCRDFSIKQKHTNGLLIGDDSCIETLVAQIDKAITTMKKNTQALRLAGLQIHQGENLVKRMVESGAIPKKIESQVYSWWQECCNNRHSNPAENGANAWQLYNSITQALYNYNDTLQGGAKAIPEEQLALYSKKTDKAFKEVVLNTKVFNVQ